MILNSIYFNNFFIKKVKLILIAIVTISFIVSESKSIEIKDSLNNITDSEVNVNSPKKEHNQNLNLSIINSSNSNDNNEDLDNILKEAEKAKERGDYQEYHRLLKKQREVYKETIKNNAKAYYLDAQAYYDRLEYDKAIESIKEAVYYDRENSKYLSTYGLYLFQYENFDEAITQYERAYQINLEKFGKDDIQIAIDCDELAKVHIAKKEYQKAIDYYKEALRIKKLKKNANNFLIKKAKKNLKEAEKALYKLNKN